MALAIHYRLADAGCTGFLDTVQYAPAQAPADSEQAVEDAAAALVDSGQAAEVMIYKLVGRAYRNHAYEDAA